MTATDDQRGLSQQQQFGIYRLDSLIGRGAVGEVYRAFDTAKKRAVALKVLAPQFAADAEFQARFRRESELAAMLTNPHIVPIHDFGEIENRLFLDMRLIDGPDLSVLIKQDGAMPVARAVDLVGQVASALSAAHAHGLLHRDVKPSNVLTVPTEVGDGDFAYLTDFGVARSVGGRGATTITGKGATIGTLEYMAPERFESDDLDHRVDVYALGCVLYECLTGEKPYGVRGLTALAHAHVNGTIPRPSEKIAGIPRALDDVVATAMAKSPDDRYATMGSFATACQNAITSGTSERDRERVSVPEPRPPAGGEKVPSAGQDAVPTPPAQDQSSDGHRGGDAQAPTYVPTRERDDRVRFDPPPGPGQQQHQQQYGQGPYWHGEFGQNPFGQGQGQFGQGPYVPPGQWPPGGGQQAGGGYPPWGPNTGQQPAQRRRSPWVWVAVAAVALLVLGGIGTAIAVAGAAGSSTPTTVASPPPSTTPPSTPSTAPTSSYYSGAPSSQGYTVQSMFGTGNGTCSTAGLRANEIDGLFCDSGGAIDRVFVQYSTSADLYVAGLRDAYVSPGESLSYVSQSPCHYDYRGLVSTDGGFFEEYIRVYRNSPFSEVWQAKQGSATWEQLIAAPNTTVANSAVLCGG